MRLISTCASCIRSARTNSGSSRNSALDLDAVPVQPRLHEQQRILDHIADIHRLHPRALLAGPTPAAAARSGPYSSPFSISFSNSSLFAFSACTRRKNAHCILQPIQRIIHLMR